MKIRRRGLIFPWCQTLLTSNTLRRLIIRYKLHDNIIPTIRVFYYHGSIPECYILLDKKRRKPLLELRILSILDLRAFSPLTSVVTLARLCFCTKPKYPRTPLVHLKGGPTRFTPGVFKVHLERSIYMTALTLEVPMSASSYARLRSSDSVMTVAVTLNFSKLVSSYK